MSVLESWSVGVVIPAQNEEATIERCIRSVVRAAQASARCEEFWIVVVADCCTDRTIDRAHQALGAYGEVISCRAGSPGTARRLGAAAILYAFRFHSPRFVWLANTDADSHVPLDWISTHLNYADANASAVAGIVKLDDLDLRADVAELYRATYAVDGDGNHRHVHGANLGVRGDAYLDVGGWSDVTVSEDHCLWGRLRRGGWSVQSPAASVVHTSGRLQGRAVGGFADTLQRELTRYECT